MRSNKSRSTAKSVFAIFLTFLLAATLAVQPAQAQTFKVLHTFHGRNGNGPSGVLVRDAAGNIYGTTEAGGTGVCGNYGCGTAFKLNNSGKQVWVHSFDITDGEEPIAGLLRDSTGDSFGTTMFGGKFDCTSGCGNVFELDGSGRETVLYKFKGTSEGYSPESQLAKDSSGNLYGVTGLGGQYGYGTIFEVNKHRKEAVLHNFTGGSDGCLPVAGLIADTVGNLYGVAAQGGLGLCDQGYGVVFELNTAGTLTVLHTFGYTDGAYPASVLIFDQAGNLYGTTQGGGSSECGFDGCGVVFELSPGSAGSWTETVVYRFCSLSGCADGQEPISGPLVRDSEGNVYGTTIFGGASRNCNGSGCGTVFKLDAAGNETVLYSFTNGGDGAFPVAGLTTNAAGDLLGVTQNGGDSSCNSPHGCGVVFTITP